jgi:hypothetical protein
MKPITFIISRDYPFQLFIAHHYIYCWDDIKVLIPSCNNGMTIRRMEVLPRTIGILWDFVGDIRGIMG